MTPNVISVVRQDALVDYDLHPVSAAIIFHVEMFEEKLEI